MPMPSPGRCIASLAGIALPVIFPCVARKDDYTEEKCTALLASSLRSDADGSGGLDRAEVAHLWKGLGDGGDGAAPCTPPDWLYSDLLCECHHSLGRPLTCCGSAWDDDWYDRDDDWYNRDDDWYEVWMEVKLVAFDDENPKKHERHYHRKFCKVVEDALEECGIELVATDATAATSMTTEPMTTIMAADSSFDASTAASEMNTTSDTTTVAEDGENSAASIEWTNFNSNATTTTSTTSTSTTASTTGSTIITTTSITVASTSDISNINVTATEEPAIMEKIMLSFLGSTGGNVLAAGVNSGEFDQAFRRVSLDVLQGLISGSGKAGTVRLELPPWDLPLYFDSMAMGIEDLECPAGLNYAAEGASCLEFIYTLTPNPDGLLTPDLTDEFVRTFLLAVNKDGDLYIELVSQFPDTDIVGLGSPGFPILEVDIASSASSEMQNSQAVVIDLESSITKSKGDTGFPLGGIVAAALLTLVIAALGIRQRRQQEDGELVRSISIEEPDLCAKMDESQGGIEANQSNSADSGWLDEENGDGNDKRQELTSPPSSLAALGMSSTMASRLSMGASSYDALDGKRPAAVGAPAGVVLVPTHVPSQTSSEAPSLMLHPAQAPEQISAIQSAENTIKSANVPLAKPAYGQPELSTEFPPSPAPLSSLKPPDGYPSAAQSAENTIASANVPLAKLPCGQPAPSIEPPPTPAPSLSLNPPDGYPSVLEQPSGPEVAVSQRSVLTSGGDAWNLMSHSMVGGAIANSGSSDSFSSPRARKDTECTDNVATFTKAFPVLADAPPLTEVTLVSQLAVDPEQQECEGLTTPSITSMRPVTPLELDEMVERAGWEGVDMAVAQDNGSNLREAETTEGPGGSEDLRAEAERLVRKIIPGELNTIDEMMFQFRGREQELVETLQAMEEREDATAASEKSNLP